MRRCGGMAGAVAATGARTPWVVDRRQNWYIQTMKNKALSEVLDRIDAWPAEAKDALANIVRDIDESVRNGDYAPTREELAGIDRGLRAADEGRFSSAADVEAALARLRDA